MSRAVLIVDDEPSTAGLLAEILSLRGYTTSAVGSAEECTRLLETEVIDLVITDVMLPGQSGIALCEQLRLAHPEVLAIVLTGHTASIAYSPGGTSVNSIRLPSVTDFSDVGVTGWGMRMVCVRIR